MCSMDWLDLRNEGLSGDAAGLEIDGEDARLCFRLPMLKVNARNKKNCIGGIV